MCERQISTENGILTCDKKSGHPGMHHSKHKGGPIEDPYRRKDSAGEIIVVKTAPLEIEWPQEGMNEAVKMTWGKA